MSEWSSNDEPTPFAMVLEFVALLVAQVVVALTMQRALLSRSRTSATLVQNQQFAGAPAGYVVYTRRMEAQANNPKHSAARDQLLERITNALEIADALELHLVGVHLSSARLALKDEMVEGRP